MKIITGLHAVISWKLMCFICIYNFVGQILCNEICGPEEEWCSKLNENEKLAYEAIRCLHRQLDDNQDGSINLDESDDFLREELKYEKDYEKRQKVFHSNNDHQVSVRELWETWVKSEVHNWTLEQTIEWLGVFVGLPQYEPIFLKGSVNGTFLPRLAVNHQQFLASALGVNNPIHRQKISLKAQDVVLFGPPKEYSNRTKDIILSTLLGVAIIVCWLVFARYKSSQRDLNKMIKDMELLSKAEKELQDLQKEMEKTKAEKQLKIAESSHRSSVDAGIRGSASDELLSLRGEVEVLRSELQRAELELQDKCWVPPPALQHWLQLTYELELKSYNKKKQSAERQLRQAKDACDKLKKKRSSLMGAFVSTHGRSIDDVDKAISEARASLTDVTQELQERMHRWKQIEMLVNCPIMNNAGLAHLESILRSYGNIPSFRGIGSVMSNSQDDIDDDGASSIYCPSAVHKLVSTSTYMMYPGHQTPHSLTSPSRPYAYQQQAFDLSQSPVNQSGNLQSNVGGISFNSNPANRCAQAVSSAEGGSSIQENSTLHSIPHSQTCQCPLSSTGESITSESGGVVSVPVSRTHQVQMVRSKSVSNMPSLRDRSLSSPVESPNRDFSTIDDEFAGEPFEMKAVPRDRRVTFGLRDDQRTATDKRNTFGKKLGNSLSSSRPEASYFNGLNVEKTDSFSSEYEDRLGNSCTNHKSICEEEPDLIKLSSNRSSLRKPIVDQPNPAEKKESNGIVIKEQQSPAESEKIQPTINLIETVLPPKNKKPGVWKRFSSFVTKNGESHKSSARNHHHKVFATDNGRPERPTSLPISFNKNGNTATSTK